LQYLFTGRIDPSVLTDVLPCALGVFILVQGYKKHKKRTKP